MPMILDVVLLLSGVDGDGLDSAVPERPRACSFGKLCDLLGGKSYVIRSLLILFSI